MNCNFCNSGPLVYTYAPSNSKIDLKVCVCPSCGLVQAEYDVASYELINDNSGSKGSSIEKISCDSDYSEIRVGKQQMANKPFITLAKYVKAGAIRNVLDMRSARGDFAQKALGELGIKKIFCIEQDKYMSSSYESDERFVIHSEKYHLFKAPIKFDLIYSCHTLEHYRNPDRYLDFVIENLVDDGLFYLDIPNIDSIRSGDQFDDFFYDKHLFYFSPRHIEHWLVAKGFEIVNICHTGPCIDILARKSEVPTHLSSEVVGSESEKMHGLIAGYIDNLKFNRARCSQLVSAINVWMDDHSKIAVFGCGRLLDTLIKYGGLDLNRFDQLIDNYLCKATSHLYGRPVSGQQALSESKSDAVLVLTRTMQTQLVQSLNKIVPNADIKHFAEFK